MPERWDAGDLGCARLLVLLRLRMEPLASGDTIEVVARGDGASHDIPAWCRMTGHELLTAEHPVYVIRKA